MRWRIKIAPVFQKLREAVLPVDGYPASSLRDGRARRRTWRGGSTSVRAVGAESHVGHQGSVSHTCSALLMASGSFAPSLEARWSAPATPRCERALGRSTHLTVPRVHMEATNPCGALLLFSAALGGKLVVSFLAHPDSTNSTKGIAWRDRAQASSTSETLDGLLPGNSGLIALTDERFFIPRGMSARHARRRRQERTTIPCGSSATLAESPRCSSRSAPRGSRRGWSKAHAETDGSRSFMAGGSKRMRFLDVCQVWFAKRIVHAGIGRPGPRTRFVESIADVIWRRAQPERRSTPTSHGGKFIWSAPPSCGEHAGAGPRLNF